MSQSLPYTEKLILREAASPDAASLLAAKVTGDCGARGVELEIGAEIVVATVGFGCLVRPVAGDRVLALRSAERLYVLFVLERLVPDRATICLPSGGALTMEAEDIGLVARKAVSIDAQAVGVRSREFGVVADSLTLFARLGNWIAEHLRVSAKTQEVVADTLSSKSLDRVAIVERADVLRAGSVSQTIESVAVTSAPAVVIATSEDLRLDGQRVTVG